MEAPARRPRRRPFGAARRAGTARPSPPGLRSARPGRGGRATRQPRRRRAGERRGSPARARGRPGPRLASAGDGGGRNGRAGAGDAGRGQRDQSALARVPAAVRRKRRAARARGGCPRPRRRLTRPELDRFGAGHRTTGPVGHRQSGRWLLQRSSVVLRLFFGCLPFFGCSSVVVGGWRIFARGSPRAQTIGKPTVRYATSTDVDPVIRAAERWAAATRAPRRAIVSPGRQGQPATSRARWTGRPIVSLRPLL